jgi:hypothetical protein
LSLSFEANDYIRTWWCKTDNTDCNDAITSPFSYTESDFAQGHVKMTTETPLIQEDVSGTSANHGELNALKYQNGIGSSWTAPAGTALAQFVKSYLSATLQYVAIQCSAYQETWSDSNAQMDTWTNPISRTTC